MTARAFINEGISDHLVLENGIHFVKSAENHQQKVADIIIKVLNSGVVKLVIFDLDNTLWQGEIGENVGVEFDSRKFFFIKSLVGAGIMASVCSRNDPQIAKKVLIEKEIYDYFIFPQFTSGSKASLVSKILQQCHLRAENCLFVDDDQRNLQEVRRMVGVACVLPDLFWTVFQSQMSLNQVGLERLEHYKLLQTKQEEMENSQLSEIEFLLRSAIKVAIQKNNFLESLPKVVSLMKRANQLNFTKSRLSEKELKDLVEDKTKQCGLLWVKDFYGDYGLSGFYCMEASNLIHYVFSCRILGMTVETAIYQYLGKPKLQEIAPLAVTNLYQKDPIDYILIEEKSPNSISEMELHSTHALVQGGCLMQAICPLVSAKGYHFTMFDNQLETLQKTSMGHSDSIALQNRNDLPLLDNFVREFALDIVLPDVKADIFILQLPKELSTPTFWYKPNEVHLPIGTKRDKVLANEHPELQFLVSTGLVTPQRLKENLKLIYSSIPKGVRFMIVNWQELPIPEGTYLLRKNFNLVIDQLIEEFPNILLLDLRKRFISTEDLKGDGSEDHAQSRSIYVQLAEDLAELLLSLC